MQEQKFGEGEKNILLRNLKWEAWDWPMLGEGGYVAIPWTTAGDAAGVRVREEETLAKLGLVGRKIAAAC
jgi:hypothetical protein